MPWEPVLPSAGMRGDGYGTEERNTQQGTAGDSEEEQADPGQLGSGEGSAAQHDRQAPDHRRVQGYR